VSGKAYTIFYADGLPAAWTTLSTVPTLPVSGTVWVTNAVPAGLPQRFYRIRTP
jgi:hypothetical protein